MIWALEEAPDVPPQCVGTLMGLANHADKRGRGAYAGQKLLAEYARKSDRQVRTDLTRLQETGIIRRGDQSLAAHIPADCRPVVFDLALERKCASARKSASARNQASSRSSDFLGNSQSGQQEDGGSGSTLPGGSENARERKPASDKPSTNQETSSTKRSRAPRRNLSDGREDVVRLCAHLADRIEANGSLRPTVSVDWLDDARLLLDRDKRTEEQVHRAIDWCQDNSFWRKNVRSMPTLRQQYDRLRLEAIDEAEHARGGPNGHQPYRNPADQSAYDTQELRPS